MNMSKPKNNGHKDLATDTRQVEYIAEILKALAHPLRIQIIAILCSGQEHVNGLAERLAVKQAIVSQQLRILRMRGLVEVVKKDGYSYYQLAEPQLQDLVACMEKCSLPR